MKTVLLSLMVLATLVSCGKDNKVSSAPAAVGNTYVSNPVIVNSQLGQLLVSKIDNPTSGFGQGIVPASNSNSNCKTKWGGLLYYCYSSSSGAVQTGVSWNTALASNPGLTFQYITHMGGIETVRLVDTSVEAKQAELRNILSLATNVQSSDGYVFYVDVSGTQYVIDSRYSIQINPSATANNYSARYFYQAI